MDIFESLEELNVSESCFNDIINIVEEILNEETSQEVINGRNNKIYDLEKKHLENGRILKRLDKKIKKLEKQGKMGWEDFRNLYGIRNHANDRFHNSLEELRDFSKSQKKIATENPGKVVAQLGNDNPAKGIVVTRVLPKK